MPAALSAAWIARQQLKQPQHACHAANVAQQALERGVLAAADSPFHRRQPLQGARRAVAETPGHEQAKVEGGSLEQHPFLDLLLTAAPQQVRKAALRTDALETTNQQHAEIHAGRNAWTSPPPGMELGACLFCKGVEVSFAKNLVEGTVEWMARRLDVGRRHKQRLLKVLAMSAQSHRFDSQLETSV